MSDSAIKTGQSVLKKITYESGKLCRVATRQVKLSSIRRQRKNYFKNLGERLYIFKVLQKEDDVWDKEEISQLLLTLSDLDQEQELLLQEINEIKAEEVPVEDEADTDTFSASEKKETVEKPAAKRAEKSTATDTTADKPVKKKTTTRKTTTKTAASRAKKPKTAAPKSSEKKPAVKTTASEDEKK
ncbi:MAG: hypothetical protein U9P07_07965 [Pseudomonadota bacterium]|nr:hypothetical protein [Pseudomonadota bacterium]